MNKARKAAVDALICVDENDAFSNIVLNDILKASQLEKNDAALASAIFYGVLDRRITLDYYIKKLSSIPFSKISRFTRVVLRTGLYQLIYMDKIPASAAVNESVNIIKVSKERRCAGFVNAILRNAARSLPALPSGNTPDEMSVVYSCPTPLIIEFMRDYDIATVIALLEHFLKPSEVYIRVNTLITDTDSLIASFSNSGISAKKTKIPNSLRISGSGSISDNDSFKAGMFHVEDLSSQICAVKVDAFPGCSFLDMCAAPGGKTFTVCEQMNDSGYVVANDLYEHKINLIQNGAKRLGIKNIRAAVCNAAVFNSDYENRFDRVLCDVPCSGTGVIGRKPEIKYKNIDYFSELPQLQYQILKNAFQYLKSGGRLVYSTCSVRKDENEKVVDMLKNCCDTANIIEMHTFLPNIDNTDGFFTAVIEKQER